MKDVLAGIIFKLLTGDYTGASTGRSTATTAIKALLGQTVEGNLQYNIQPIQSTPPTNFPAVVYAVYNIQPRLTSLKMLNAFYASIRLESYADSTGAVADYDQASRLNDLLAKALMGDYENNETFQRLTITGLGTGSKEAYIGSILPSDLGGDEIDLGLPGQSAGIRSVTADYNIAFSITS